MGFEKSIVVIISPTKRLAVDFVQVIYEGILVMHNIEAAHIDGG